MLAAAFGGDLAGVEQCLYLLPGVEADHRFVRAGLFGAFVADDADVVGVAQQLEEPGTCNRPRGALRCRHGREAARGNLGEQVDHGAIAGRVLLEYLPDQRCPFWVDVDGAVLAALLVLLAHIQIADRCPHRSAAGGELLAQAFRNLVGEVLRVELGDARHDAVQQRAGRSFIDVLRRRDEGDACGHEPTVDLDIVEAVACESVDLVHDAVRDLVGFDVFEHLLQVGAVRRACGLARVGELGDHARIQGSGFLGIRFALGGGREPFVTSAFGGVLFGRGVLVITAVAAGIEGVSVLGAMSVIASPYGVAALVRSVCGRNILALCWRGPRLLRCGVGWRDAARG